MNIEDRLHTRLQHAGASIPEAPVDLGEVLRRGRRARRVTMALAAGAAAAVAGLALWGSTELLDRAAPAPVPPIGDRETPAPPSDDQIEATVRAWLRAVEAGDVDAAWALMSDPARADVGRARFEDMMRSELPEGFGAYADPDVDVTLDEFVVSANDPALVAILEGEIEQEGQRAFTTEALALAVEGEHAFVDDRFDDVVVMTVGTSASLGPRPFRAGDRLVVEVAGPDEVTRVYLVIDGGPQALEARPGHGPEERWTAILDRPLTAGLHGLTIVVVDTKGRVLPQGRVLEADAP